MLHIEIISALSDNYIYLLHEPESQATAVVDPALAEPVLERLQQRNWHLDYVLNTHHHHDHVGGNLALKQATGCRIAASRYDHARIPGIDDVIEDGDSLRLGHETLSVIATPGHTLGHIVFYAAHSKALFCGDTLFSLGCGRLFEGTAQSLWQSLQRIKQLPGDTQIYCAHEYTAANGRFAVSVEPDNAALQQRLQQVAELRLDNRATLPVCLDDELNCNPFLRCHSASIRHRLHLDAECEEVEVFAELRRRKDVF